MTVVRKIGLAVIMMLFSFSIAWPVGAQTSADETPPVPEQMTPEAINAMVARMSDDEVRAFLIERLDAVAQSADPAAQTGVLQRVDAFWTAVSTPATRAFEVLPDLPANQAKAFKQFAADLGGSNGVITLLGLVASVLLVGLIAEKIAQRFFALKLPSIQSPENEGLGPALLFLSRRLLREMLGLIVFYVVIRITGRTLLSPEQIAQVAPFVIGVIWMPRVFAAFSRFVLSPNLPALRLVNVNDAQARFLHRGLVAVFVWSGFTIWIVNFNFAHGIQSGEMFLGFWLDSLVYVLLGLIAWRARAALQDMMLSRDPELTLYDQWAARLYPFFVIAVAAGTWVVVNTLSGLGRLEALLRGAHYTTLAVLLAVPLADTAVRGLARYLVPPMAGDGPKAEAAHFATKRSYVRIGRVFVIGIGLLIIAQSWSVQPIELLGDRIGIGDNLFRFLMTLVVGYLVYEGSSLWINGRLQAEMTAAGPSDEDAEMGGAGQSRLSTVLPLALLVVRSAVVVIFGLLAIGNLGIDITPLLAGAGIAGLAIGFGAQKLVTDVVSGVFFLVDDAFRIGEYVEIDGTMGSVEKISIRSMQLRHHRGPVHTIPYGEIPKLTNYSRDWVIVKLKFTVPFDTDPNLVKKIFKKIGLEMMETPEFKEDFLQPFKSQGVLDFDDVGMVIRGKFMAKPGKQFMIRKEIFNRVKKAFEENGISFARREVRVALPDSEHGHDLSDAEKEVIAAAAAEAVQEEAKKV